MRRSICLVVLAIVTVVTEVAARDLEDALPQVFGPDVSVATGLGGNIVGSGIVDVNAGLSSQVSSSINSFRSQLPVPSASAAYTYEFDPDLDLWLRSSESLGPLFSQRAQTLGQGKFSISTSYSYVHFDTFFKTPTNRVVSIFPVGEAVLAQQPAGNQLPGIADDIIRLDLSFDVDVHNLFLFASYGVTDNFDVQVALPVVYIRFQGDVIAHVDDPGRNSGNPGTLNRIEFARNQPGRIDAQTLQGSFDEETVGLGDVYLRGKYHFLSARKNHVDIAGVVTGTIPTGGGNDFRGFKGPTITPQLVLSRNFGFVSPHANIGYSIRGRRDGSQFNWAAGADLRVASWLTLVPDFLGVHDTDTRAPIKTDVYQYSMGLKLNPWRQLVLAANFQFPLNREGLRANVIYTAQAEYSF